MADNQNHIDTEASELARQLAARRRIVEGTCEVCGKPFTGTRKKRYCGHNCAQKAYDRAHAQARRDRAKQRTAQTTQQED